MSLEQLSGLALGGWAEAQAVAVLLVSFVAARLVLKWSGAAMRREHVDLSTQILVKRALVVAWIVLTVLFVLGILGVSPAALVTVGGVVSLAFGLAVQDILKNFFSGVYLLLERPFQVGDTIRVKEQLGVVENIGVRTTQLRTKDNVQVLVPNATVFGEVVANHTYAQAPTPSPDSHAEADQAQTRA
jgi:small conductance mechanosensitive channel